MYDTEQTKPDKFGYVFFIGKAMEGPFYTQERLDRALTSWQCASGMQCHVRWLDKELPESYVSLPVPPHKR